MRGKLFTTDESLTDTDLFELVDELAMKLYATIGFKVYLLDREGINKLVQDSIDDITEEDQNTVIWLMWHMFAEALEIEVG